MVRWIVRETDSDRDWKKEKGREIVCVREREKRKESGKPEQRSGEYRDRGGGSGKRDRRE